jgi:hypothetical protein
MSEFKTRTVACVFCHGKSTSLALVRGAGARVAHHQCVPATVALGKFYSRSRVPSVRWRRGFWSSPPPPPQYVQYVSFSRQTFAIRSTSARPSAKTNIIILNSILSHISHRLYLFLGSEYKRTNILYRLVAQDVATHSARSAAIRFS